MRRQLIRACLATLASAAFGAIAGATEPDWLARYDGPDSQFDRAHDLAVADGFVIVTGESDSDATGNDLFVVKYTTDGDLVWSRRFDGAGSRADRGLALAIGADGTIVVAGQSWSGDAGQYDLLAIAYGPDGELLWTDLYDGPLGAWERGMDVVVDGEGHATVTGWSAFADDPDWGEQTRWVTIQYDTDGQRRWLATHTGPGPNHDDRPVGLVLDAAGDVYVAGASFDNAQAWDYATVKYRASDGQELWERRYDFGVGGIDEPYAIASGGAGLIAVTGISYTDMLDGRLADVLTIVYDTGGVELWRDRFAGPAGYLDAGQDLAVGPDGAVTVTGDATVAEGQIDLVTLGYSAEGERRWARFYDGEQGGLDIGLHVAAAADGGVVVTGQGPHSNHLTDVVTLAYDADGLLRWSAVHATPMGTNDFAAGVATDPAGRVYVAATSSYVDEGVSWDAVAIRYPALAPTAADLPPIEDGVVLHRAAPNPFNPQTELRFRLPAAMRARLTVHDLRGRRQAVLVDGIVAAGEHRAVWRPRRAASGIYVARLDAGGEVRTRRLVLVE